MFIRVVHLVVYFIAMLFRSIRRFSSQNTSLLLKELYQVNLIVSFVNYILKGNSVVRIALNDPKRRNALSLAMIDELTRELEGINSIQKVFLSVCQFKTTYRSDL